MLLYTSNSSPALFAPSICSQSLYSNWQLNIWWVLSDVLCYDSFTHWEELKSHSSNFFPPISSLFCHRKKNGLCSAEVGPESTLFCEMTTFSFPLYFCQKWPSYSVLFQQSQWYISTKCQQPRAGALRLLVVFKYLPTLFSSYIIRLLWDHGPIRAHLNGEFILETTSTRSQKVKECCFISRVFF